MIKSAIKRAILSGPHRALQSLRSPKIVALRYHSVQDDPMQFRDTIGIGIIHARKEFQRQVEYLATNFVPISIEDLPAILTGNKEMKRRGALLTFDDGYRDNVEVAAEILQKFGIRGVFYITVSAIEGPPLWFCQLRKLMAGKDYQEFLKYSRKMAASTPDERNRILSEICGLYRLPMPQPELMMTWEQVRALHRRGHIVGSHTLTHPNVAHISRDDAEREIAESRLRLERELGAAVRHFSYPHPILEPCFDEATTAMCSRAGYATAVLTSPGTIKTGANPFTLNRIAAPQEFDEFRWQIEYSLMKA